MRTKIKAQDEQQRVVWARDLLVLFLSRRSLELVQDLELERSLRMRRPKAKSRVRDKVKAGLEVVARRSSVRDAWGRTMKRL